MLKETLLTANGSVGCLGMLAMFSVCRTSALLNRSLVLAYVLFTYWRLFKDGIYPRMIRCQRTKVRAAALHGASTRSDGLEAVIFLHIWLTGLLMVGGYPHKHRVDIKLSTQTQELNLVALKWQCQRLSHRATSVLVVRMWRLGNKSVTFRLKG